MLYSKLLLLRLTERSLLVITGNLLGPDVLYFLLHNLHIRRLSRLSPQVSTRCLLLFTSGFPGFRRKNLPEAEKNKSKQKHIISYQNTLNMHYLTCRLFSINRRALKKEFNISDMLGATFGLQTSELDPGAEILCGIRC